MRRRLDLSVYLITDRTLCGARGVLDTVREAIAGGVSIVQLRDPEAKTRALVEEARALVALLRPAKIPFIVNDRVDVALAADADGVHIGQKDMVVADARRLIGRSRILGLSITSEADLDKADLDGVDYLGVGPIYASATKPDAAPPIAIGGLRAVAERTSLPIVAIGGLHAGNAEEAIDAGAQGIAVVSAICAAPDALVAAAELAKVVAAARAAAYPSESAGLVRAAPMPYTPADGGSRRQKETVMTVVEAKSSVAGVGVRAASGPRYEEVLNAATLAFLADLHRKFNPTRLALLQAREERQKRFDAGELPDFLPETGHIREGDWRVAPIPADLLDRRVEITGPVDRKMIINALNSGAKVFMADFEDANAPTWANLIEGQINLKDRWAGKIDFTDPATGKAYKLVAKPAVLLVRPRGWHLPEEHLVVDGEPMSGSLFDFGLYFFLNAKATIASGTGPISICPSSRAISRRGSGTRSSSTPSRRSASRRHHQGDGADRDAARRLRDGRDPLRAARPYGRAQLRPLGLHLLLHQDAAQQPGVSSARPRPGGHGQGLPEGLFGAPHQDLPSPRRLRHGRHGGADPRSQEPGGERGRLRQGPRRQGARGQGRP